VLPEGGQVRLKVLQTSQVVCIQQVVEVAHEWGAVHFHLACQVAWEGGHASAGLRNAEWSEAKVVGVSRN
jgi:hypothetical protein